MNEQKLILFCDREIKIEESFYLSIGFQRGKVLNQQYSNNHQNVAWQGYNVNHNDAYQTFMATTVRARLNDLAGRATAENHLRPLATTGFEIANLNTLLDAIQEEERDWAVGESFSEAILEEEFGVIFPWNNARDTRNENASLPGADIVGLINDGGQQKLLFGEVKTSVQEQYPPNVLYGRSGMTHQLETIGTNSTRLITLVLWLLHRCKGTDYEPDFNEAFKYLIHNTNKGMYLVGILVRPNIIATEADLQNRGIHLGNIFNGGAIKALLLAYYLPHSLNDFANLATEGGQ